MERGPSIMYADALLGLQVVSAVSVPEISIGGGVEPGR
jgi:hypothetical protein